MVSTMEEHVETLLSVQPAGKLVAYDVKDTALQPTLLLVKLNDTTGDCAIVQSFMVMGDDVMVKAGAFRTHGAEAVGVNETVGEAEGDRDVDEVKLLEEVVEGVVDGAADGEMENEMEAVAVEVAPHSAGTSTLAVPAIAPTTPFA